eukprot:TRINITY_DN775_c0_g1_i3.p2 TRINITY_DN775_c0_g1~~TRINITY_DN775_c0_g1_i3.p2  ORF type:complete len:127 (+),score=11.38 TRINITY_DN775_c0_g1_i3:126-506(+)
MYGQNQMYPPVGDYPPSQSTVPTDLPLPHYQSKELISGMDALQKLSSFYIEQKAQYLEMCGCEFENEYTVYSAKYEGKEMKKDQLLFMCKESLRAARDTVALLQCGPFTWIFNSNALYLMPPLKSL